jgi:hypothetical protein
MKTVIRWLLLPALVAGFAGSVRAQDSGEPRKTGKILLLKTGMVMEGDIEQLGSEMCIRRGSSELRIAADQTMRLCPDWIDAYAFLLAHTRKENANERLALARWCHANRLLDEAIAETKAALTLQPDHAEAKQLMSTLERLRKAAPARVAVTVKPPEPLPTPRPAEPAPTVDVTAETMIAFTTKVQPILMNTCASCHATDAVGKFRLQRVFDNGRNAASQRNLAAVLEYVDLERPTISPLLVKAITPHGKETKAPLKDRSTVPFQSLQHWIADLIRVNPQLKEYRALTHPTPLKKQPEEKPSAFSSQGTALPVMDLSRPLAPTPVVTPPSAARVRDWCDPEIFNEWAHPRTQTAQMAQNLPR